MNAKNTPAIGEEGWRPTKVHPLAAIFPMLPDGDLQALAWDIKANGQQYPIVVGDDGVLWDGRNRLRACEIAEVEPEFEIMNGVDHDGLTAQEITDAKEAAAKAFIVSANLNRRNLNRGQQAVLLAFIYPEPEKGGRGKKGAVKTLTETMTVSASRLTQARSVLAHSRALAERVAAGDPDMPLDTALKVVREEQQQANSTKARLERVRDYAPDIAALVDDERLTLEAAQAVVQQRQDQTKAAVEGAQRRIEELVRAAGNYTVIEVGQKLTDVDLLADIDLDAISETVERLRALRRETQNG